jgi:DNA-binding IscR family transcriptional regulator
VTHGILHSTRGVDGGYALDRKPEEISLLDLIEAIEGPVTADLPSLEGPRLSAVEGRLRAALDQVAVNARRQLDAIKLSDLLGTTSMARLA